MLSFNEVKNVAKKFEGLPCTIEHGEQLMVSRTAVGGVSLSCWGVLLSCWRVSLSSWGGVAQQLGFTHSSWGGFAWFCLTVSSSNIKGFWLKVLCSAVKFTDFLFIISVFHSGQNICINTYIRT